MSWLCFKGVLEGFDGLVGLLQLLVRNSELGQHTGHNLVSVILGRDGLALLVGRAQEFEGLFVLVDAREEVGELDLGGDLLPQWAALGDFDAALVGGLGLGQHVGLIVGIGQGVADAERLCEFGALDSLLQLEGLAIVRDCLLGLVVLEVELSNLGEDGDSGILRARDARMHACT